MALQTEEIAQALEKIRCNNRDGATRLTQEALALLQKAAKFGMPPDTLRRIAWEAARARPMMAQLHDLAERWNEFLKSEPSEEALVQWCESYRSEMAAAAEDCARLCAGLVGSRRRVLTLSGSSLVEKALLEAHRKGHCPEVVCCESRPLNEGTAMAERLCRAGLSVTVIVDAAAGEWLKRCDLVLVGCDGFGPSGLVHKIGTFPLFAAAEHVGVERLVAATRAKIWPADHPEPAEPPKPPEEVAQTACAKAANRYFDITPPELLQTVATERGVTKAECLFLR